MIGTQPATSLSGRTITWRTTDGHVALEARRFAGRLDHQHLILLRIEAGQCRTGQAQLVAEDENQIAHGRE